MIYLKKHKNLVSINWGGHQPSREIFEIEEIKEIEERQ
jgi:hypothetical protein